MWVRRKRKKGGRKEGRKGCLRRDRDLIMLEGVS
jgi:hypothetical protein